MKRRLWKALLTGMILIFASMSLTACKPSKKKVEQSSYYKELMSKYKKLKKENAKLQEASDNQEKLSDAEERAEKFLAKIARNTLTRVEVGYPDAMEDSHYIEEKEVYGAAINIATKANRTAKYTPEEIGSLYEKKYIYMLYDENNAIYEVNIYDHDYVVFSDLPNYVYYVPDASVLGDAFLQSRVISPASNTLHLLSETPVVTDSSGHFYNNNVAISASRYIEQMTKEKTNREAAVEDWKKDAKTESNSPKDYEPESVVYSFFNGGKVLSITVYDRYVSILNADENRTWYKTTKNNIKKIKMIFQVDLNSRGIKQEQPKTEEKDNPDNSHSKEIEEESVISKEE